jgi:hypothetical protein
MGTRKTIIINTLLLAMSICTMPIVVGQTIFSQQAGNWASDCTWDPAPCGGASDVPSFNDPVQVDHALNLNANLDIRDTWTFISSVIDDTADATDYTGTVGNTGTLTINATTIFGGVFQVNSGGSLIIKGGDTLFVGDGSSFGNGSTFNIEANGVLHVNGNLTNNNNSDDVIVNGKIIVDGTFTNGNGGTIEGDGSLEADIVDNNSSTSSCLFGNCGDAGDCTGGCIVLPIELVFFQAKYNEASKIDFNWATASELNNDYFSLQVSNDLENWETLFEVEGAGTSHYELHYNESVLVEKSSYQYARIMQFDYDGKSSASPAVTISGYETPEIGFSVYPNPVQDVAKAVLESYGSKAYITILDDTGLEVVKKTVDSPTGVIEIDFSDLSNGMYIINVVNQLGKHKNIHIQKR